MQYPNNSGKKDIAALKAFCCGASVSTCLGVCLFALIKVRSLQRADMMKRDGYVCWQCWIGKSAIFLSHGLFPLMTH